MWRLFTTHIIINIHHTVMPAVDQAMPGWITYTEQKGRDFVRRKWWLCGLTIPLSWQHNTLTACCRCTFRVKINQGCFATLRELIIYVFLVSRFRGCIRYQGSDRSWYALSKYGATLQCNVVIHWLSPYPEWPLYIPHLMAYYILEIRWPNTNVSFKVST